MSTTALFAEIVIIGMQASVWICILVLSIWPDLRSPAWDLVKGKESLLLVLLVSIFYTLGILVDRISDNLFNHIREKVQTKTSFRNMRFHALGEKGRRAFIDYQRHRLRIARATLLNSGLGFLSAVVFVVLGCSTGPRFEGFALVAVAHLAGWLLLLVVSIPVARKIDKAQTEWLVGSYRIWEKEQERLGSDSEASMEVDL